MKYVVSRYGFTWQVGMILALLLPISVLGQTEILLRGTVYDSTRMVAIPMVRVTSTGGNVTYTDSVGQYRIVVSSRDSVAFFYRNRSTVRDIKYVQGFDVSLQITVTDRYKTLKEVVVIQKTHRQDSIENREKYRKAFGFERGLSITTGGDIMGGAGLDPNSIINLFRFRMQRSMRSLQNRLLAEEAEKFVNYRFNKNLVKNLTGLEGMDLDRFMIVYRPSYEFTAATPEYQFYQYILDASRLYRQGILPGPDFWQFK
jgi:hypothetical protein